MFTPAKKKIHSFTTVLFSTVLTHYYFQFRQDDVSIMIFHVICKTGREQPAFTLKA